MRKTALITGASSGIGASFARLLAKDDHDLVLVARRADRLQALASELEGAHGVRVTVLPADLTAPDAPANLRRSLEAAGIHVDLLVNNAGFGEHGTFDSSDYQRIQQMIDLNISALTALTHTFLPAMLAKGQGGVLNVASTAAFQAIPYMAVYAATKAYVLSFSEAIAEEVAARGVKVACLCPGPTTTEFSEQAHIKSDLFSKAPFMSADAVAAEGLAALRAGRPVQIAGLINAISAAAPRLLPRQLVTRVSGQLFKPNR